MGINDLEVSPKNIISFFWKDSTLFEQVTVINKNEAFNVILSAVSNNNLSISFQSHGVAGKNIKVCHLMSKCEVHKKLSQVKIKFG